MNSLIVNIESIIKKSIADYTTNIASKYNLDFDELIAMWNESNNDSIDELSSSMAKVTINRSSSKPTNHNGCKYVFTRGATTGSTCNAKLKSGSEYCSRHVKYESEEQKIKEKKIVPVTTKTKEKETPSKPKKTASKPNITLRMNKDIKKFWNPETQLVFKAKDDRVVVASYRDEELSKLTEDDIMLCEQYGFKYDLKYNEESKDEPENHKPKLRKVVDDSDSDNEKDKKVTKKTDILDKVSQLTKMTPEKEQRKQIADNITNFNTKSLDIEDCLAKLCDDDCSDNESIFSNLSEDE